MLIAKERFDCTYRRIIEIHDLYRYLKEELNYSSSFLDDLLRSEIVYVVSALDRFIHDIVKVGILEAYNGRRLITPSLKKFSINLEKLKLILDNNSDANQIIEEIIVENHKHLAFQDPTKIAEALSLIWGENHKWQKISNALRMDEVTVKVKLRNIIIRRNQIVHESDIDLFTNTIQEIEGQDVIDSVMFVKKIVDEIYSLVKLP